jgi:D-inositol-3-phosphate glycosyltransferase
VVATESERRDLTTLQGVAEDHIGIVPGGVDPAQFGLGDRSQARRELGLPDRRRIFLAVGRPAPVKGFGLLLEAIADQEFASDLLILVGEQPDGAASAGNLREVSRQLGLGDRVLFPGRIDHHQIAQWYSAADCVVVPSYLESFGLVALEALACGTPVIAATTGGMAEYIAPGRNGFLFEPGDRDGLRECLRHFVPGSFHPQALRESVSTWTWGSAADRLLTEYTIAEATYRNQQLVPTRL